MADDPTRYLDVSGVLALKAGSTVDVDYTVTHARSVAARDRELGASVVDLTARVAAVEAGTSGGAAFTVNAANHTATFTTTTGA